MPCVSAPCTKQQPGEGVGMGSARVIKPHLWVHVFLSTCRSIPAQEAQVTLSSCWAKLKLQHALPHRVGPVQRTDEVPTTAADGVCASGWDRLRKGSPGAANRVSTATTPTPCGGLGHHGF